MEDGTEHTVGASDGASTRIAPGVAYMTAVFANLYFVDADRGALGAWALIDTGLAHFAGRVRHAAEERHGQGARRRLAAGRNRG